MTTPATYPAPPPWGGDRVRRLTLELLSIKGTTCHLCGLAGASSPDHEPPRSKLVGRVPNPDALVYLFPAHRSCNVERQARPITPALRLELRARRQAELAGVDRPNRRVPAVAATSPRFLRAPELSGEASFGISPRFARNPRETDTT